MKTNLVTIHQAKTNLSRLIQKALGGEEVIIARGSKPVARLLPIREPKGKRRPGSRKGTLVVGREFFEVLPPDELSAWGVACGDAS
jgi:prevent-host-death family protein